MGNSNGLAMACSAFRNGFARIDMQLLRRSGLIPKLVKPAKGYISHERKTMAAAVAARSAAQSGQAATQSQLNAGLGRLLAAAEAYPDL